VKSKTKTRPQAKIYFSEIFGVSKAQVIGYGAFDPSVVADLPLFIDPFLLFQSKKKKYRDLHENLIKYLGFLRDRSSEHLDPGLIKAWYTFPEVSQNWFGFSRSGNRGHGLGMGFAKNLNHSLDTVFRSFGDERVTEGTHLEKVCLIKSGVGKDNISDFTTNLIKEYLLEYTATFARRYIEPKHLRTFNVPKVHFDYETESWVSRKYTLPSWRNDFVLLTPFDLLTKDETWINRSEMLDMFEDLVTALPNDQLRGQVSSYVRKRLDLGDKQEKVRRVRSEAIEQYPQLIEYYIRTKELGGEEAPAASAHLLEDFKSFVLRRAKQLIAKMDDESNFYETKGDTCVEALKRLEYLKHVIEERDGWRIFWDATQQVRSEKDVQIMYDLTWNASTADVNKEVNNGRGPADFKISKGAKNTCIVEVKLASNSQLKKNLENQTKIYEKAARTKRSLKLIVFFTAAEKTKVEKILRQLNMAGSDDIILVDARRDNKPSASKATESD
jgi:hypothetical protein